MSLEIDPTKIHVGGANLSNIDNRYYAEYSPAAPNDPDGPCVPPPLVDFVLPELKLVPINPTCVYTFPDIVPLPPIYNPPPVEIIACESLTANTAVPTIGAARTSYLHLSSAGPKECGITLTGLIDVIACEDFIANADRIVYGSALERKSSGLVLTPTSAPHCGVELTGLLDIDACEDFQTSYQVEFGNALRASSLKLVPTSAPHCGAELIGNIDVIACEDFTSTTHVTFNNTTLPNSYLTLTPRSTPHCGVDLTGNIEISACEDFTARGSITASGILQGSATVTASGKPNCGVTLEGSFFVPPMCEYVTIENEVAPAPTVIKVTHPDNSEEYPGNIKFWTYRVPCDNLDPCCQKIITDNYGDEQIEIQAGCLEVDISSNEPLTSDVVFKDQNDNPLGILSLLINTNVSDGNSPCQKLIDMRMANAEVTLDLSRLSSVTGVNDMRLPLGGCDWDILSDGLQLRISVAGDDSGYAPGTLHMVGSSPLPCFSCEYRDTESAPGDGTNTKIGTMDLDKLHVGWIDSSTCCDNDNSVIDMCLGVVHMQEDGAGWTTIGQASINMEGASSNAHGGGGEPCNIYMKASTDYAILSPGELTLGNWGGQQAQMTINSLSLTENGETFTAQPNALYITGNGGGSITMEVNTLQGKDAYFQQIDVCVNGEVKQAYVLMTTPE